MPINVFGDEKNIILGNTVTSVQHCMSHYNVLFSPNYLINKNVR